MRAYRRAIVWLALAIAATPAAADYMSAAEPAVLYDTPSTRGKKLFVLSRGTPVEVLVTLDNWARVRDATGELAWAERKALSDRRTVVVTAANAVVRAREDDAAPAVFQASNGVVLEYVEPAAPGWIRVRHRDGESGFVRIGQVWGA
jgi:SH3-like domain-containing protein